MIGLVYKIWIIWNKRLYQTSSFISLKISDMIKISISNERGKREEGKHYNRGIGFFQKYRKIKEMKYQSCSIHNSHHVYIE